MSMSIAYNMKKRAQKCHGGKMADGGMAEVEISPEEADKFKKGSGFAEGGECDESCEKVCPVHGEASEQGPAEEGEQSDAHDMDMIGRIMAKRMSKGGMVANEDLPEADFEPNEFDDLHLRDELESKYTGANSGDEKGNDGEDERRKDRVMRIMMKRSKQHNPRPA